VSALLSIWCARNKCHSRLTHCDKDTPEP
jgi:hypothetical protein